MMSHSEGYPKVRSAIGCCRQGMKGPRNLEGAERGTDSRRSMVSESDSEVLEGKIKTGSRNESGELLEEAIELNQGSEVFKRKEEIGHGGSGG